MKKFYLIVIIQVLLIGCCHQRACVGFDAESTISLYNFHTDDVDSIAVEIFETSINGKIRIDSFSTQASGFSTNSSDFIIALSETLKLNHSYKITLSSKNQGQVYTISDLATRTESCNNCVIKSMNSDYAVLNSYTVNGRLQYYTELQIIN